MSLPRYKFDPVTQKYTLLTSQQESQGEPQGGLRTMDSGGGDNVSAPSGSRGPGQGISPTAQAIGLGGLAYGKMLGGFMPGSMLANVVGGAFADQQLGALGEAQSNLSAMDAGPGRGMGIATVSDPAGNTYTRSGPESIAAADEATFGLAAMNAAVTEQDNQAQAQQVTEQAAAEAVQAASALAMSPGAPDAASAAPAAAAPAADSGGASAAPAADSGGSNEFGGDVGTSSDPGSMGIGGGFVKGGLIPTKRYADGGMTMSPQNYGRMGDSMLVHMNPREVAGLQSLARSQGTSMTVNPQTGYPEAFNLQALLPTLIGLGLTAATGGAAAAPLISGLSNAATIGLGTGALTAAATGSLKKGLQAGLGAYGGAGIGEGLIGTAGAATPVPSSVSGVTSTYPGVTPGLTPNTNLGTGGFGGSTIDPYNFANPATVAMPGTVAGSTATIAPGSPLLAPPPVVPPSLQSQISPSSFTPDTALSGVSQTPDKFIGNLSGKDVFKYGTAVAASIPPPEFEPPQSKAMLRPYDYSFNPITGAYDPRPGDSSEVLYGTPTFTPREVVPARAGGMMSSYAAGGLAAFKEGGRPKSRRLMDEKGLGGIPYYDFMGERGSNLDSVEKNFAQGGTPRFLSGGGDGMSDDIPAVIGNKQPARLADGEFVIPADVVSHIGNGSSKAGAKKLYKMMADIREGRTGKTKQAPAIKPERYMPA